MKRLILILLVTIFSVNTTQAQISSTHVRPFNIYAEAGTNIIVSLAALNVERHMVSSASNSVHLYGRMGVGATAIFYGPAGYGGLGGLTLLTGKQNHHFEANGGLFLGVDTGGGMAGEGPFVAPILDIGYRFQKPEGGVLFKVKAGLSGFGFGLGYAF